MSTLPALVTIAGLCCLFLQLHLASSANLTINPKHIQLPINNTVNTISSENGTFVYVLCRELTNSQGPKSLCSITLDTVDATKSCDLKPLDTDTDPLMYPRYLTSDKAILTWKTKETKSEPEGALVLTIVHFYDACRSYDIRIRLERTMTLISHPYYMPILNRGDGSFDIVYDNVEKCGDKACKVGFDYQGKKVRNEMPWILARDEKALSYVGQFGVYNLVPDSPEDGYLVHNSADTYITLWTKDDGNGPQKLLRNFTTEVPADELTIGVTYSVAHKLLTMCHYVKDIPTKCDQIDFHNTSIVQPIEIVYSDEYNPAGSAVHSLSGGGFLLASIVGCPIEEIVCSIKIKKFVLKRYGRDGKTSGKIEVGGFEYDMREGGCELKLYEKEEGRYCLSQWCVGKSDERYKTWDKMNLSVTCFSDKDFS